MGTGELVAALEQHRAALTGDAERERRIRLRRESELLDILEEELRRRLEHRLGNGVDGLAPVLDAVRGGTLDPYSAALRILEDASTLEELLGRA